MWIIQQPLLRIKHRILKLLLKLMNIPVPELLSGAGKVKELPEIIKKEGIDNVLFVTDKVLMKLGLPDTLLAALDQNGIRYIIFDNVEPNPTIQSMEDGLKVYLKNECKGIIAFGGGSPMDCAKVIGVLKTHPGKTVFQMRGLFKIKNDLPPVFAIPTTAGTGSEATIAAVVTDPESHEKFGIGDGRLVPKWAVLDPELTVSLPPHITVATGMDALTHAIEAYVSFLSTDFTDKYAEKAVALIFANLEKAYKDGLDLDARNNMLLASYYAGISFTRAMVGYVHAIAHNMGGLYGVPHGLANAIILPHVLDYSRKNAEKKLAKLAIVAGIGGAQEPTSQLAEKFIDRIKIMNLDMNIPTGIKELQEKDIPIIVKRTLAETNMFYAPPRLMSSKQCTSMIKKLFI